MGRWTIRFLTLFVVIAASWSVVPQSVAQPANAPANTQANILTLKPEELDQLVAPIALYPDNLLSEVLMASTYPLEVVQAERWLQQHKDLKGDALKAAVDKQTWDDSVKSLVATPTVIDMMSSKIDWTQKLGNAVIAQQADVMDAIQRLRAKAEANDKLKTTKEQTVTVTQNEGKRVIAIAPADPNTMYVPYYDPAVVYGPWPYPDYPPYYWPPPAYIAAGIIATGIAFGAGYALGRWVSNGYRWGGGFNWGRRDINFNRPVNINAGNVGNRTWVHNPVHRQGVRYTNPAVAAKFGGNRVIAPGAPNRLDFRGRGGQQVLQPGPGFGAGPGAGAIANRPPGTGGGANLNTLNRGPGGVPGGGNVNRPAPINRPAPVNRPANVNALGNISSGSIANVQSNRGRSSFGAGPPPRVSAPAPRIAAPAPRVSAPPPRVSAPAARPAASGGARRR